MELTLRVNECPGLECDSGFKDSKDVWDSTMDLWDADREMFLIYYLDTKNRIIKRELHTIGSINSSAVYPREVFRSALLYNATSIICVHNHPSGDTKPSQSDDDITEELVKAGKIIGIEVLDHLIVSKQGYYSFADKGKI